MRPPRLLVRAATRVHGARFYVFLVLEGVTHRAVEALQNLDPEYFADVHPVSSVLAYMSDTYPDGELCRTIRVTHEGDLSTLVYTELSDLLMHLSVEEEELNGEVEGGEGGEGEAGGEGDDE